MWSNNDGSQNIRVFLGELTYRDNDGRDESPADFEEQRRREAQHHLNIFKIFPVTYRTERGKQSKELKQVKIEDEKPFFTCMQIFCHILNKLQSVGHLCSM